ASARVGTGDLNRVLQAALEAQPPPLRQNRRAKIYYATQVASNPPTIVLFTNGPELFDNTYLRYLLKAFRDNFPFRDVPIKLHLRRKKREDGAPGNDRESAPKEATGKKDGRKKHDSVPGLRFTTSLDDESEEARYGDSELWRNL